MDIKSITNLGYLPQAERLWSLHAASGVVQKPLSYRTQITLVQSDA